MGIVDFENQCGKALYSKNVFHEKPRYDIKNALKKMGTLSLDLFPTHLDVIALPNMKHVFFGNTLKLEKEESGRKRTGYLTIGAHGGFVLNSLAKATHQDALFISGNRIVSVSDSNGQELAESPWYQVDVQKLLSETSGLITVDGKEYFFLHLAPYKLMDLHFFIFNPKEVEFVFVDYINKSASILTVQLKYLDILVLIS